MFKPAARTNSEKGSACFNEDDEFFFIPVSSEALFCIFLELPDIPKVLAYKGFFIRFVFSLFVPKELIYFPPTSLWSCYVLPFLAYF